jgi:hypothetical protein
MEVRSLSWMNGKVKRTFLSLLHPKAIFFGLTLFLLIYVWDKESKMIEIVGCYDCGWFSRQVLFLFIASLGLLVNRFWGAIISLLLSMKVAYSSGHETFWNNMAEVNGNWRILKESLRWAYQSHPEFFIEIFVAVLIGLYATFFLWRDISRRYSSNRTASNNSLNRSAS